MILMLWNQKHSQTVQIVSKTFWDCSDIIPVIWWDQFILIFEGKKKFPRTYCEFDVETIIFLLEKTFYSNKG